MSDYDPSRLLALCRTIMSDDELSYDELYQLADWLNMNREACFHWPGDLLVKPLQALWADGKATAAEAREIADLLATIRKEAERIQRSPALAGTAAAVATAVREFVPSRARLPSIPHSTTIESRAHRGIHYEVNLVGPTCTCPDFSLFRYRFPQCHLTRCCKHVFDVFAQVEPKEGWPAWLQPFLELPWTPPHQQDWTVVSVGAAPVLISTAPIGWANAFVSDRGPYELFGYSVEENRWSYQREPRDAAIIKKAIISFVASSAHPVDVRAKFDNEHRCKYPSFYLRHEIANAHREIERTEAGDNKEERAELREMTALRIAFWKSTFSKYGAVSVDGDELIDFADAIDTLHSEYGKYFKAPSAKNISGILEALDTASADWDLREPHAFYATLKSNFYSSLRSKRVG